jgi:hypothetical protein
MDGNKQTAYFHQHPNMEITDYLVSMAPLGAGQSWSEWIGSEAGILSILHAMSAQSVLRAISPLPAFASTC